MPIKITDLRAAPTNISPDYTLPGVKYLNKYDAGYRKEMNQEWNRSNNQTWYNQLGSGLVSRGLSIGTKFAAGVGSVLGAGSALASEDITDIWDNPLVNAMNNADDALRESLPIYKSKKYMEGGLFPKMGSTSFWFDDGFDGLAFLASAYGGGVIGKGIASGVRSAGTALGELGAPIGKALGAVDESLVSATKTFGSLEGGMPVSKLADAGLQGIDDALGKYVATPTAKAALALRQATLYPFKALKEGLKKIGGTAHQGDLLATTAYNTIAEAGAEAYQTYKEIEGLLKDLRANNPEYANLTDEDIKLKAATAASETFWLNSAVLAVPNFVQSKMMHGSFRDKAGAMRKSIWDNKGDTTAALKDITSRWRSVGEGVASEGLWEENIQTAIQQYERAAGTNLKYNKDMVGEIAMNYANGLKGFVKSFLPGFSTDAMEDESAISIMLGGLIGGGMGARSAYVENNSAKTAISKEKTRYDRLFNELGPAAGNLFIDNVGSIYTRNGTKKVAIKNEKGEDIEIDSPNFVFENGELQKNPQAITNLVTNQLRNKHLFDAQLMAVYKNDPLLDEYNKQVALSVYAHDLVSKGYTAEEVAQQVDSLTAVGTQEAKDLGVDTFISDNMDKVKEYAKALETIAATNSTSEDLMDEDGYENLFKSYLNKTSYYAEVKKKALENIKAVTKDTKAVEAIDTLLKDIEEVQEQIRTDKKGIREEYFNTVAPAIKMHMEYNELLKEKAKSTEQQDRFDKLDYLVREEFAINGKWAAFNNSHANTYGATNKELVNTLPGTRQEHYYNLGRQALAVEQAKQNIAAGEDVLRTANALMDNAYYSDPEFKTVLSPMMNVLDSQKTEMEDAIEGMTDSLAQIDEYVTGQITVGEMDESTRDLLLQHDAIPTDGNGSIDPEAFISDQTDPAAFQAALEKLLTDLDKTKARLTKTNSVLDRYNELDEQDSKVTEHLRKLLTDNAEDYLVQKYFQDVIANPAKNEIARFEANPDAYYNLNAINDLITSLQRARKAFEGREGDFNGVRDTIDKLYDKLTNVIRPKVIENREARRAKQAKLNNSTTVNMLSAMGLYDNNSETGKLVKEVLGADKIREVLEIIEDDEMLSYDGAMAILATLKAKVTDEQFAKIAAQLSNDLTGLLVQMEAAFKDNISDKRKHPPKNFLGGSASNNGKSAYQMNPQSTMVALMRRLFNKEISEGRTIAYKYMFDHDLDAFADSLEAETQFSSEQKNAFKGIHLLHLRAAEISKVISLLENSMADYSTIISAKEGLTGMAPTPQQNIILSDALSFYLNEVPTTQSGFEGWMLVKGIAGSGKSFVVGKMLSSLISKIDTKAKGFAFSSNQFTSDNINKAIFGHNNNSNNLEQFMAMDNATLSALSYLIIDEVFTIPGNTLEAIRNKLKEYHKATGKDIKVIALGDPSQTTADETTAHPLMTHAALKSIQTFAMSVSYRTNVGAIASFVSSYQLNPSEVDTAFVQANKTPQEAEVDMSTTVGVHAGNVDQLIRLVNAPSSRSRVVLVSSTLDRDELRKSIPVSVPILLYKDAQGYQWDEVYTYLDKGTMGTSAIERNRGLYTAFSRAKQYLYVTGLGVSNIEPDAKLSNSIDENPEDLRLNAEDYKTNISTASQIVSLLTGAKPIAAPVVAPTPIEVTDDEESFDAGPATEDVTPIEDPTGIPEGTPLTPITVTPPAGSYAIAHPTNYNVGDVKAGSPIHIIRAKDRKNKDFYYIVANTSGKTFVVVGVLGNKDFTNDKHGPQFKELLTNKSGKFIPKDMIVQEGFIIDNIDDLSLQTGTLDNYSGLGNKYENDANGLVYRMQNDIVEDIIKKFYNSFFGVDALGRRVLPDTMVQRNVDGEVVLDKDGNPVYDASKEWVVNGKINWDIVKKHAKVVIYDRRNLPNVNTYPGVPYLEIIDPRQASIEKKDTKTSKSILIPMQPKKFSTSSSLYSPIRKLYDALSELSTIDPRLTLGSTTLTQHLEKVARSNFKLEDVGGVFEHNPDKRFNVIKANNDVSTKEILGNIDAEVIANADRLIDELIPLIFAPDLKRVYLDSEDEAVAAIGELYDGKKVVKYKTQANGKHVLQYQADTEGEDIRDLKVWAIRAGKGSAQRALNVLAQANKYLTDGSGTTVQLRIEQQAKAKRAERLDEFKISKAKSLLSTESYIDYAEVYRLHPEWEVNMGMFKSKDHLKNHLLKHGKVTSEEFDNIIFNNTHHPITLGILELVVGDNYFDAQGNHALNNFYLREPLDSRTPSKTGINDIGSDLSNPTNRLRLASQLRTAYQGTKQTQASISLKETTKVEDNGFEDTTSFELLSRMPKVYDEDAERVRALLLAHGKDTRVAYDSLDALKGKKGGMANADVIFFNYPPDSLGQGGVFTLLHEMLHANLNRAQRNAIEGTATEAEIRFSNEILAIMDEVTKYASANKIPLSDFMNATISELNQFEFVANLAYPPFIEMLKKIKIDKKSGLSKLIDAILDLLGLTSTTVYDVMFKSVENFLNPPTSSKGVVEEYLGLVTEFKKLMKHTDKASQKYYKSIYNFETNELEETFIDQPMESKIKILKDILTPPESSGDDAYYGYYNEPGVFFSSSPGALITNQSVLKMYETVVGEIESVPVKNLVATILSKQIQDPVSKILPNIITYGGDMENSYNLFYTMVEDVMTESDRRKLSEELEVDRDDLVTALMASEVYAPIILEAATTLMLNRNEIENLVESSDLFATRKYTIAREYIIGKIRENKETSNLIKTKGELLDSIRVELSGEANPAIPIREELERMLGMARALSAMVTAGDNSKILTLRNLLEFTIPSLEQRLAGLSALTSTNSRTGKLVFYDIVSDIYPKNKVSEDEDIAIFQEQQDSEVDGKRDKELENSDAVGAHIKKYNKSYETTLSESIKDFLSLVTSDDKLLNPSLVYIKTLQYITSIDMTTLDRVKAQLNDTLSDKGLSNVDRAIYTALQDVIVTATNNFNKASNSSLPTNIGIVTNLDELGRVYYKGVAGQDVSNISETGAKVRADVEMSDKFYNSTALYKWMNERTTVTIEEYNGIFKRTEAINALRELQNVMGSMKETELMVGTRTNKKGVEVAYIRSKAVGINTSAKESIKTALEELHKRGKIQSLSGNFQLLDAESQNAIFGTKKTTTVTEKKEAIKSFFNFLGLSALTPGLTIADEEVVDIIETIIFINKKASAVKDFSKDDDVNASELSEDSDEAAENSIEYFIKDMDAKINILADVAARSSIYLRNPSVKSASGEKFYKFHESSWAYDIMLNLIRMKSHKESFKGTRGGNEYRKAAPHLATNFYDHNIFKTGLSEVVFMAEHEALKNTDNESITPYMRETKFHYFQREFVQGFLDGARQYNGNSFFLFSYTPSDKPKTPLFRVSLLSDKGTDTEESEIKRGLRAALQQFLDKEVVRLDVAYYNDSNKKDRFRNFALAEEAQKRLGETLTSANITDYVNTIHALLEEEASALADEMMEVELTFDVNTFRPGKESKKNRVEQNLEKKIDPKFNLKGDGTWFSNYTNTNGTRKYAIKKAQILPLVDLYVKNHYVNSFHLHQLFTGDYAAYKGSSSELVKRMAGAYAPGIRGLVDPTIGMKEKFEVLVLQDTAVGLDTTEKRLRSLVFNGATPTAEEENEFGELMQLFGSYEIADAQGFMLPSRYGDLEKGFGRGWGLANVMKPVHFELVPKTVTLPDGSTYSTTIPVYMKYSSIVLEDTLVQKFPILGKLRAKLEQLNVDELIFHTGVKTGIPTVRDTEGNEVSDLNFEKFMAMENVGDLRQYQTTPLLSMSNQHFRLQHNPAGDPRKNVSIFTQLMYFLNVYENTFDEAREAYSLVGELIKLGREEFLESTNLRSFLAKKFNGPGAERALELLRSGVSLNNPLLEKKSIIALASGLEAATIKIKFPGGKLVLQTPQGIEKYYDKELFANVPKEAEELAYKTEIVDGVSITYAEVIVPTELLTPEMLEAVKKKKTVFMYGDGMGFRIPSSELHSAIPLRIVGTYSGSGTNVIIAPKELIPIHGSDFDVDSLTIVMRENYTTEDLAKTTVEQLSSFIDSLSELKNLVTGLEEGMTQAEANLVKKFRNLLLSKYEAEQEADSTLKKEMSPEFQKDLRSEYLVQLKSNSKLTIEQFAIDNGYKYSNGLFRVASEIGSSIYELEQEIKKFERENSGIVTKYKEIKTYLNKQKALINEAKKSKGSANLSLIDTPIGYMKNEQGLYVTDPTFLDTLNEELESIELLLPAAEVISKTVHKQVQAEIKRLKKLKVKFLKNGITEVMLRTISAKKNLTRIISPITFEPLQNAKRTIPNFLLPNKFLDLSNPRYKYKSFQSLADGAILIRAFANAVKVFGYVSRAGGEDVALTALYADLSDYKLRIKHFGKVSETLTLKELLAQKNATSKLIKKHIANADNQELRPFVNPMYEFNLSINNKEHLFNRFTEKDVLGKYGVTTVFDSLLNAAIDNLKLGLLPEIRVNTRTGSSVVAMVSLGVPIDNVVQMLYSPILSPLVSGTVDNTERWAKGIEEKYAEQLARIRTDDKILTDAQINKANLDAKAIKDMSESELDTQLRIFDIFMKANRMGEDVRNMASFLDIIRQVDVFIEDIDGVYADFHNKIGTIQIEGEDMLMIPKESFSLITPNIFRNNPHIKEAYHTHLGLIEKINETFDLHSTEVRAFVDSIKFSALDNDEEVDSAVANSAKARSSVASMLLSNIVWGDVASESNTIVSLGADKKLILSKARSFSERVAKQLKEVQTYVRDNKANSKVPNRFLDLTVISKNPRTNTLGIRLVGGVNLNSTDIQEIARGFRMLNQFTFENDTLVKLPPNQGISQLQRDLLTYAVINYGLQFSTSNFSNVIDVRLIKELDEKFNSELEDFKYEAKDNTSWKDFFYLTYHMMNANRLGFVDFNRLEVTSTITNQEGKVLARNFVGKDGIEVEGKVVNVYYDRKVKKATKPSERPNPSMFSVDYKNKSEVFMKVTDSSTHDYYQKVGKVSEAFYTKMNDGTYSISKYFNPNIPTIDFTMVVDKLTTTPGTKMKLLSGTNAEYLKKDDVFYVVPAYNFDRQERILVKLVSKSERIDKKYRSYQYEVEVVDPTPTSYGLLEGVLDDTLSVLDTIDQGCK